MAITDKVREYAASQGVGAESEALELGMREKSAEFVAAGGEVYLADPDLRREDAAAP
jgi:phosphomethylpyrimidine synthase